MALNYDDGGAIDEGESWSPPASAPPQTTQMGSEGPIDTGEDWQPPAGASQQTPAQAPAPQQASGLPDMGPPPYMREAAQQTPTQGMQSLGTKVGQDVSAGVQNLKNDPVVKRIMGYLMGADAAAPQTIQQTGQMVDPQGQMSPDDRNLLAVKAVNDGPGGPAAAWRLVQANRVSYNAKQAFAKVALDGTPQKPANLGAAIDAANQASQHILDGSQINFSAAPQGAGVTAAVKMPGTSQTQQIPLTVNQFKQWVDVGGAGQWDKVMEGGAPAALQALSKAPETGQMKVRAAPKNNSWSPVTAKGPEAPDQGTPEDQGTPPAATPSGAQMSPAALASGTAARTQTTFGHTPSSINLSGSEAPLPQNGKTQAEVNDYGADLESRANTMFPGSGQNTQRQAWMAQQEEQQLNRENQVNVAKEKGEQATKRAMVTGTAHVQGAQATAQGRVQASQNYSQARMQAAQAKVQQEAAREEQLNGRSQRATALRALSTKISTGAKLEPAEQSFWDKAIQGTPEPPRAPAQAPQGAQAGQAPARPANVPPGAKLYQGKWYTRGANGESVPVQ